MQIDTQLFYTDMTSDLETEAGEMSISANLYVNAKGASPKQKAAIREILERHYKDIRFQIYGIERNFE